MNARDRGCRGGCSGLAWEKPREEKDEGRETVPIQTPLSTIEDACWNKAIRIVEYEDEAM
jgi:hypothetical protein